MKDASEVERDSCSFGLRYLTSQQFDPIELQYAPIELQYTRPVRDHVRQQAGSNDERRQRHEVGVALVEVAEVVLRLAADWRITVTLENHGSDPPNPESYSIPPSA